MAKAAKTGKTRKGGPQKESPPSRQKRMAWIVAACLIPALLIGLSLYAKDLTMTAWDAVVDYQSPYLYDLPGEPATCAASTDGVLLIIIDGLRIDTSQQLDNLNAARAIGADLTARTGQPSLSNPAAAVIPSGTSQEIHGVTTNWYEGLLQVDNLFEAAKRSGKTTAVVAGKGWVDLYGDSIGQMYKFDDASADYDKQVYDQTMAILNAAKPATGETSDGAESEAAAAEPLPDLMVVHFGGVDGASHEYGGTSPENLAAAKTIDGYVGDILRNYDTQNRTVIITADHGHIATGGHGGWEPEVINVPLIFAGKDVVPGQKPEASQMDIAPTISALLGMSMPAETVGTILDSVVSLPPEQRAKAFIDLGRTRYAFSQDYFETVAKPLGPSQALSDAATNIDDGNGLVDQAWVNLTAGDPELAVQAAKGGLYLMDQGQASVKNIRLEAERGSRLSLTLILALLPLLGLFYLGRNKWFTLSLAGAVGYFALHSLLFYVIHGYRLSLSIFNEESMVESFFNSRMIEAGAVAIVVGLIVGLVAGWKKSYRGPELAEGMASMSYLIAYGLGLQTLLFYYLYGINFSWFIPNLVWGFKFYADCLQVVPTGLAAAGVVLVGLAGAKLASVLSRGKSATPPISAG